MLKSWGARRAAQMEALAERIPGLLKPGNPTRPDEPDGSDDPAS